MKHIKLFEEHGSNDGEHTTEEMGKFLHDLITTMEWPDQDQPVWKRKVGIMIPSGRNTSTNATSPDQVIKSWDDALSQFGKDANLKWFVWSVDAGGSLNKPKQIASQRFDIDSILGIAKKHPDAIRSVSIGFHSDQQGSYDEYIRKEYYSGRSGGYSGD